MQLDLPWEDYQQAMMNEFPRMLAGSIWGQMYAIGCLKGVYIVQGQQDDPLS